MRKARLGGILVTIFLAACSTGTAVAPSKATSELDLCATEGPCPLKAGTYSPTLVQPAIRFTVGVGWSNELNVVDCITLSRKETDKLFLMSGVSELGTQPEDVIAFANLKGLTITHRSAVQVAGQRGLAIDVSSKTAIALFVVAGMNMSLDPSQQARLIAIPARDRMLVILLRTPASDFQQFMVDAQRVINKLQLR